MAIKKKLETLAHNYKLITYSIAPVNLHTPKRSGNVLSVLQKIIFFSLTFVAKMSINTRFVLTITITMICCCRHIGYHSAGSSRTGCVHKSSSIPMNELCTFFSKNIRSKRLIDKSTSFFCILT